jgi:GNAT superfamily N-acetyltransferase
MKNEIKAYHLSDSKGYGDFSETFLKIRDFLCDLEKDELKKIDFPWGRWAWMFSLPYLDSKMIEQIIYFMDEDKIVGLLTYESNFGDAYYVVSDDYEFLKPKIIEHAIMHYDINCTFRILIPDHDTHMIELAKSNGLIQSDHTESTYIMDLDKDLSYTLAPGFKVTSLRETYDIYKYGKCLHQGFNHEETYKKTKEEMKDRAISLSAPGIDLNLNVAIMNPKGAFISYCGLWYMPNHIGVLIEPVATIPAYRKQGFGKAAIYEALNRAKQKGAKIAVVGSSLMFYQKLGFTHFFQSHFWIKRV